MNINLTKKIVLLTGAGKGIGEQILKQLINEKAIIYAVIRDKKDIKKIKKNKKLFLFNGDVRNDEFINNIFQLAKKNKHIFNCLINNAGMRQRKKFSLISNKDLL